MPAHNLKITIYPISSQKQLLYFDQGAKEVVVEIYVKFSNYPCILFTLGRENISGNFKL